MDRKNQKNSYFFAIGLGGPMGPIHPVWALAAVHPGWGNRYATTPSSLKVDFQEHGQDGSVYM